MDAKTRRACAEAIARDLFTCGGSGEKAQRLVLTIDTPEKRTLAGWGFHPAIDRIELTLEKFAPTPGGTDGQ